MSESQYFTVTGERGGALLWLLAPCNPAPTQARLRGERAQRGRAGKGQSPEGRHAGRGLGGFHFRLSSGQWERRREGRPAALCGVSSSGGGDAALGFRGRRELGRGWVSERGHWHGMLPAGGLGQGKFTCLLGLRDDEWKKS